MGEQITRDPAVMLGKPVIAGTRVTVEHVLRELAAGATVAGLVEAHPHVTEAGVRAALEFVLELVERDWRGQ